MQLPIEVTFRDMDRSEALEARVLSEAAKLEKHFQQITSCRVTLEAPHRHQMKGRHYEVQIELRVPPATTLMVDHVGKDPAHEDPYVAVRDAFRAAARRLDDYAARLRGEVKARASRA